MRSLIFVFLAFVFMFVGRKVGWILSRGVLYRLAIGMTALLCLLWGVAGAFIIHILIAWQHPNLIVKIVFGYMLGAYVAVPNYGLVSESSIPLHAVQKHNIISLLPVFAYIAASIGFGWLG